MAKKMEQDALRKGDLQKERHPVLIELIEGGAYRMHEEILHAFDEQALKE